MGKVNDINGKKFEMLTVLKFIHTKNNHGYYLCKCECGKECITRRCSILSGSTKSCGCLMEKAKKNLCKVDKEKNVKENTRLNLIKDGVIYKHNTTGVRGVSISNATKKPTYMATINFKCKNYFLGRYHTLEEAAKARKQAEEIYFKPILEKYNEVISNAENY